MKIYVFEQMTKIHLCYLIDASGIDKPLNCYFMPMPISSGIHRKVIFNGDGTCSPYSLLSNMFRHVGYQKSLAFNSNDFRYGGKS